MNRFLDSHIRESCNGGDAQTVYVLYLYSKIFNIRSIGKLEQKIPKNERQVTVNKTFEQIFLYPIFHHNIHICIYLHLIINWNYLQNINYSKIMVN